jgi:prophage DNA circulation protein
MNYQDRLHEFIVLNSPLGTTFSVKWRGDKITGTKKVAQFNYPLADGTVVQDLGLNGLSWPLTLYFDDDPHAGVNGVSDNDLNAMTFMRALAEKGTDGRAIWSIVHPVYGTHKLQPISFELDANPTESGGVSVVTTQWVEPILQAAGHDPAEDLDASIAASANLSANSASQLTAAADLSSLDKIKALAVSVTTGIGAIKSGLNQANQAVQNIESNITAALNVVPMSLITIAQQCQALLAAPGAVIGGINQQIQMIGGMFTSLFAASPTPTTTTPSDKNAVAATEMIACACLMGMCNAVATGTITTRVQAVQAISDLTTWLAYMRDSLDARQAAFSGMRADLQYFSQSQAYADAMLMVALTQKYLQWLLFDLKASKTWTLQTGRATMEISMSEYGVPGQTWNDYWYFFFCDTNNLHGNDILWLPAGRKVSVYL